MSKYIDIDKAFAEVDKGDLLVGNNAEWAKEIIDRTPREDVAPVVHGQWVHTSIEDDDWGGTYHKWSCSACGWSTGQNPLGNNYCPNCGAKMDKENIYE